jgi:hypothetical protein
MMSPAGSTSHGASGIVPRTQGRPPWCCISPDAESLYPRRPPCARPCPLRGIGHESAPSLFGSRSTTTGVHHLGRTLGGVRLGGAPNRILDNNIMYLLNPRYLVIGQDHAVGCEFLNTLSRRPAGRDGMEVLLRGFRDRRAVARYAGLTGAPDESSAKRSMVCCRIPGGASWGELGCRDSARCWSGWRCRRWLHRESKLFRPTGMNSAAGTAPTGRAPLRARGRRSSGRDDRAAARRSSDRRPTRARQRRRMLKNLPFDVPPANREVGWGPDHPNRLGIPPKPHWYWINARVRSNSGAIQFEEGFRH